MLIEPCDLEEAYRFLKWKKIDVMDWLGIESLSDYELDEWKDDLQDYIDRKLESIERRKQTDSHRMVLVRF